MLRGIDLPEIWSRLRPHLRATTFLESPGLDEVVRARVLLVSETFQHTGSFKFRAAMAAALETRAPELLTASSGNFGAALARAASILGKRCTVVMPMRSAAVKMRAVERHGARIDLVDTDRKARHERIAELRAEDRTLHLISPYDDLHVIAGNGSLGAELFAKETPAIVVAPIGGGGLSAGMVVARDEMGAKTPIIGAEPRLANDAARSLREGRRCANQSEPETLCDGARTLSLGRRNFAILRHGLEAIVEVEEAHVASAVRLLFETANLKAEPTGALALAALLADPERFEGKRVACIVSGGNVDPENYVRILSGGWPAPSVRQISSSLT